MTEFSKDQAVLHTKHGEGRIVAALGETVVVRFGANLQQVEAAELQVLPSLQDSLTTGVVDEPLSVITRALALLIQSVNDQWGVFSRSRVKLLPHQLWVCRQVTRTWPTRWLVADDVGLGKTIEAGLILESLAATSRVRRLLVLTPARLVPQWRSRLKKMFDIRLQEYAAGQNRGQVTFWDTADRVVASFHTLRQPHAREELLEAEPWDMVMVDEAHHFQPQERASTLTYELLQQLEEHGRANSIVLFTGTPHRGRDYGFLALMQLLRPDLFDPGRDISEQLPNLHRAMIRNNKALATDLQGNKLFQPVTTEATDYSYSSAETDFYQTMSSFILDGRAYAVSLGGREQTARMLLLIALQKLAASSIAAICRALERRRETLKRMVPSTTTKEQTEFETLDEAAEAVEALPSDLAISLMRDEISRLDELIALGRSIRKESKVTRLISLIEERLDDEDESLLLFTEYKATQALVYDALEERFGKGSVGFINGDERLDLTHSDGSDRSLHLSRDTAAADFNAGRTRFLISTEAGGEGIDLQERCAKLVHIDLPWNPMRLHQRVGRVNRYGQARAVKVFLLRNPDTVEARIWALLEEKLSRIQAALSASMEEAEDITQLVIGMAGSGFFDELYSEATSQERLSEWFDVKSRKFGGHDAVETVRSLIGSVVRYDFQSAGEEIPKLDLPELEPFFRHAMQLNGRRVTRSNDGLSVATPDAWKPSIEFKSRYDGLVFDRTLPSERALVHLLGVGHPLIDRCLTTCSNQKAFLSRASGLERPLIIAIVEDEVTGTETTVHRIVAGVEEARNGAPSVLRDWEVLLRLNAVRTTDDWYSEAGKSELLALRRLTQDLEENLIVLNLPFNRPKATPVIGLLPA